MISKEKKNIDLNKLRTYFKNTPLFISRGEVTDIIGKTISSKGPEAKVGDICIIKPDSEDREYEIKAEVIGFKDGKLLLMPIGDVLGVSPKDIVYNTNMQLPVKLSFKLLGRILDGLGNPIDDKGDIKFEEIRSIYSSVPHPLQRKRIKQVLSLGIKSIDGILTIGKGQRIGIFAGSGIGKSTLMGMVARYTNADINVIGLVGERGREVREFIEKDLGKEGLKRSVVVVATGNEPALVRLKAAYTATTIAEYFRDKGKDVLLMMDSVTRFARAQREIALSVGEMPATRAYPPSVFTLIPELLERAGTSDKGSITGLYTVLIEADDMNEPIADTIRGTLDGHIVLARELAAKNHYPAVDILDSVSRVMPDIVDEEHLNLAKKLKETYAIYKESEDLINIGAYVKGSNEKIDYAIKYIDKINDFLKQQIEEKFTFEQTKQLLGDIFK